MKEIKDQLGNVRVQEYDGLGRPLHDRVTTLGTGVDSTVRRISRTYESRGNVEKLTSYSSETVGNLATLRRLALNLLNQDRTKKRGIKGKQLNASWDHAYLLRLLAF